VTTNLSDLKKMILLEANASLAWKSMSSIEKRAYAKAFPASRFAKASETDDGILGDEGDMSGQEITDQHDDAEDNGEWNPKLGFPDEMRSRIAAVSSRGNAAMGAAAQQVRAIENPEHRQLVSNHFAKHFASQNPNFKPDRWHKAAGTQSGNEPPNGSITSGGPKSMRKIGESAMAADAKPGKMPAEPKTKMVKPTDQGTHKSVKDKMPTIDENGPGAESAAKKPMWKKGEEFNKDPFGQKKLAEKNDRAARKQTYSQKNRASI